MFQHDNMNLSSTEGDVGNTQYNGCVRCILNNTLYELMKNPSRTFIFAEMKYFARFWHEASTSEKNKIRHLIKKRESVLIVTQLRVAIF